MRHGILTFVGMLNYGTFYNAQRCRVATSLSCEAKRRKQLVRVVQTASEVSRRFERGIAK